jgi:hypothetical protein
MSVLEIYDIYQLHLEYRIAITYYVAVHFNILFVKQIHVKASVWGEVNIELRSNVSLTFWTTLNCASRVAVSSKIVYHTWDETWNINDQWMNSVHKTCTLKVTEFWYLSYKGSISYLLTRDRLQNIILKILNIFFQNKINRNFNIIPTELMWRAWQSCAGIYVFLPLLTLSVPS